MAAIEEFANSIKTHATAGDYAALKNVIITSSDLLNTSIDNFDNILNVLNVEDHCIGILEVLNKKLLRMKPADLVNDKRLLQFTIKFISECDKTQICHFVNNYTKLCRTFSDMLVSAGQTRIGIYPMCEAVNKLRNGPKQLTTLHAEVCRLCLHAKIFKPALKYLDDMTDLTDEGNGPLEVKSILLYFYYGGTIYVALKNYQRALYFFEIVITVPARILSQIMIASYKKYILISLLLDSKDSPSNHHLSLPKQVSQVVVMSIKTHCKPYLDISTAYYSGDSGKLSNVIKQHADTLKRDNNSELANQVYIGLFKKRIHRLKKCFVTLPIDELAKRSALGSETKAEYFIREMICDSEIRANICKERGIIEFPKPEPFFNNATVLKTIESRIKESIEIEKKISAMDEELSTNSQFLERTVAASEDEFISNLPKGNRKHKFEEE